MKPLWLVWLTWVVERLPEPGPKAISTVYGLLLFTFLVQVLVTIMYATAPR